MFFANASKCSVYYHIWSPDNTDIWKIVIDEQLKRLYKSNIQKHAVINCAISGPQASRIRNFVSMYSWVNILDCNDSTDSSKEYEGFTLKYLYEDCVSKKYDKVLYFHTKGISHFNKSDRQFRAVNSWRHLMEAGCIDNWVQNVLKLDTNQVSGVNYESWPWPHMSGNFWWARADYVSTLNHPTKNKQSNERETRLIYERWIGVNNPKVYSLYNLPEGLSTDAPEAPRKFWLYRDDIFPYYITHL